MASFKGSNNQQAIYQALTAVLRSGRLCHAYLFSGSRGIGKKTAALWFAAAILCRGGDAPCGECSSCKKVFSGIHPDVYCYDGKQGINAIHIDVIRSIRQDAYILPNEGAYKIYLIPEAENMTIGAANALLKVLEEPPPHAVFLLTSTNRDAVPETIRSRCICLAVPAMDPQAELAVLRETYPERAESDLEQAVRLSDGVIGRALEELSDKTEGDISRAAEEILSGIAARNEYTVLAALQAVSSREGMLWLFGRLQTELRYALQAKISGAGNLLPQADRLANMLTAGQMEAMAALIEEMRAGIAGNAGISLLANCFCAELMRLTSY